MHQSFRHSFLAACCALAACSGAERSDVPLTQVEPARASPEQQTALRNTETAYTNCLKDEMPRLVQAPETAEVVTDAVMAACADKQTEYVSAFRAVKGKTIYADTYLDTFLKARRQEVLDSVVKARGQTATAG